MAPRATNQGFARSRMGFCSGATNPVILRRCLNPSEGKTPETGRKYYRPFWPRSLTGAAFRAMTGRTVNPQVPGSSPGRGANLHWLAAIAPTNVGYIAVRRSAVAALSLISGPSTKSPSSTRC